MRILVVDAFTDRPFAGNPAGVCLLDEAADPAWMQRVAAELRHSETAFVRSIFDEEADFELRWFTPAVEVALCGHGTLATAHALYETGRVPAGRPIRFRTLRSGGLTVRQAGEGLEMDFPAQPLTAVETPAGAEEIIGVPVRWAGRNGNGDLLLRLAHAKDVRDLDADPALIGTLASRGVIVTARADEGADHDYVSRFFAANVGVDEDPVTGSAHCALAPYWSAELGRAGLVGYQASERGGHVRTTVLDGGRVRLAGTAVTVLDGELRV
ncbi:PhzF family phenazine biosynthesis protein [Spirillospora sp. CA-294931]|uniref:PhzF family phenazine biosynthesis protein n=1 Tax=Spirillospora sp. CA-294931 TaxID=3240042 RepID=UPI003D914E5C